MKKLRQSSTVINFIALIEVMAFIALFCKAYTSKNIMFTNREMLIWVFAGGMLLYALFFFWRRFLRFFPFPVKITAENTVIQASLAQLFLNIYSMLCVPVFCILLHNTYRGLLYTPDIVLSIPAFILPLLLLAEAGAIAAYIIIANKNK